MAGQEKEKDINYIFLKENEDTANIVKKENIS